MKWRVSTVIAKRAFIIETERLILRPLGLGDLTTAHAYASDRENTQYMIHLPNDSTAQTQQFLARVAAEWLKTTPSFYEFAITLDGMHIGAVSVALDESRQEGELGWIVHKAYQGNGYATEAAGAILGFAKNELKLKRIVAHCDYRNEPSSRVMRKIGLSLACDSGTRRYRDSEEAVKDLMYALQVD